MGKRWKKQGMQKADLDHKFMFISNSGNRAFLNGQLHEAIDFYNQALKMRPNDANVRSNRGAAFVRVRAFHRALEDFSAAVQLEIKELVVPTVKTLRRMCKAKWGLMEYDEGLFSLLEKTADWHYRKGQKSEFNDLWSLIKVSRRMQRESRTGQYDMITLAQRKEQVYDCGEYCGPVDIRQVPGKGRGLVACRPINAGQVILGSKAFAIAFPSPENTTKETENTPKDSNNPFGDAQPNEDDAEKKREQMSANFAKLNNIVTSMLMANSELCEVISALNWGNSNSFVVIEEGTENDGGDGPRCVDLERVLCHNGTLSGSNPDIRKLPDPDEVDSINSKNTYGLWIIPSYLNHSCVDINANVKIFGDFMIVRALRDIAAGEEVLVCYTNYGRLENESYAADFVQVDDIHDFICHCRLCKKTAAETVALKEKRKKLVESAVALPDDEDGLEDIEISLEALESNHPDLNFSIFWICRKIANLHWKEKIGMYRKAACYCEKAYDLTESSGYFRHRIQLAIEICLCYIKVADEEKATEWGEKLSMDLLKTYGAVEEVENFLPIVAKYDKMDIDDGSMANLIYYCYNATKNKAFDNDPTPEDIPLLIDNIRRNMISSSRRIRILRK